jgi:hypothetical protein
MVKIDVNPGDQNSPIEFFPSRAHAERAICDQQKTVTGRPRWLKVRLWTVWYIWVANKGFLREDGSVY